MYYEKCCPECHKDLQCTFTGCDVYLAHTNEVHCADLFMCFECKIFYVFGLNKAPTEMTPNVVVAGGYTLVPYGEKSSFSYVDGGEVIPLPRALKYMVEKCRHDEEISAYLLMGQARRTFTKGMEVDP